MNKDRADRQNLSRLLWSSAPTEDLQLLIDLAKEYAAGTPREMSEAETKAHEAFEASLALECRNAGMGKLENLERLLDAARRKQRNTRAGSGR